MTDAAPHAAERFGANAGLIDRVACRLVGRHLELRLNDDRLTQVTVFAELNCW